MTSDFVLPLWRTRLTTQWVCVIVKLHETLAGAWWYLNEEEKKKKVWTIYSVSLLHGETTDG